MKGDSAKGRFGSFTFVAPAQSYARFGDQIANQADHPADLERLDFITTEFDTAAWSVYPGQAYLPLKVRVFVDFFRAVVEEPAQLILAELPLPD